MWQHKVTWGSHLTIHILGTGLLAGGTGVTAMINLATVILKNPNDKVKVGQSDLFLLPQKLIPMLVHH